MRVEIMTMRAAWLATLGVVMTASANGGSPVASKSATFGAAWDELLRAHVDGGRVDYAGIARDKAKLASFLSSVAQAHGAQDKAFYLNAYNALVVASILNHQQPARVTDVAGFFDKERFTVAGQSMTLNDVENHVRKTWPDPRIHFALNCAAIDCPPLHNRAFGAATLDATLDQLTSRFINGSGVRVSDTGLASKSIAVSKIFDWYKDDFVAKEGSVSAYLKKWVTEPGRTQALDSGFAVTFQDYDWRLNKK
jgi:uncharacterized protein DUF547